MLPIVALQSVAIAVSPWSMIGEEMPRWPCTGSAWVPARARLRRSRPIRAVRCSPSSSDPVWVASTIRDLWPAQRPHGRPSRRVRRGKLSESSRNAPRRRPSGCEPTIGTRAPTFSEHRCGQICDAAASCPGAPDRAADFSERDHRQARRRPRCPNRLCRASRLVLVEPLLRIGGQGAEHGGRL
jgi:hypothetical protein